MENEVQGVSVKQVAVKWGLILGMVSVILTLIVQLLTLYENQWAGWIGLPFSIAVVFLAHNAFKNEGDGFMSYGQGLGIGVLLSLIASVISSLFNWVYLSFVDDGMIQFQIEKAHEEWEKQGMSSAQIEQAEGFMDIMMNPVTMTILGIVMGTLFGFLISLVVSAITQKKNPEFA
ncbi:MAG: DUF4199 domain-containing protein [bacterium]|nr:DUF4199 domain-containing protein [bacterium]